MNKRLVVGIATGGQTPREDVIPEIKRMVGEGVEILECGVCDGLSLPEIDKLAPEEGEVRLVTRLRDGSQVWLARDKIIDKLQRCVDSLVKRGAELVIINCFLEYPKFRSPKLVVTPNEPFCGFALGLLREGDRLGLIVPGEDQFDDFTQKWSRKKGVEVVAAAASPYSATSKDECARAAEILKGKGVDLVVMDCPGYTMEVKGIVQQITGKPVLLARSVLAAIIRQVLS